MLKTACPFVCLAVLGLPACSASSEDAATNAAAIESPDDNGPRVCADSAMVIGIDLAHYAGTVNWATLASEGVTFAAAKATQGNNIRDPQFATYWAGMQQAGVIRGAYHFFIGSLDGVQQADLFLATVGPLGASNDLPPVLDLEDTTAISSPARVAAAVNQIQRFVNEIRLKTGLPTILFMAPSYWVSLGSPASLANNILWISNTGATCPNLPAPWPRWTFWQYLSNQTVTGAAGNVDLSVFNGSIDDLRSFAAYP